MAAESKSTIENIYLPYHKEIDKNWNLPLRKRKSVNGYPDCFDNKYLNTMKYIRDWDGNLYRWVSYNTETKDYKVSWWIRDKFLSCLAFSARIPNGFFWLNSLNSDSCLWYKSLYKENQCSVDFEFISSQNFPIDGTGTYYKNFVYSFATDESETTQFNKKYSLNKHKWHSLSSPPNKDWKIKYSSSCVPFKNLFYFAIIIMKYYCNMTLI
ncbi:unnamed protein product [Blepharisma stoltei]|uniref:Uncharacterized protein n=1 Tax=Blepharisma stoltei TaxID=1481888 RepID=A0AAU9JV61_9CILI|nr:unnamed protein product [Blepharisma stoltei]